MRILVSTGIFPNPADPTRGIYIYKQVEALMRRCEVRVIAPVAVYPPGFKRGAPSIPDESTIDGLRVLHPRYFVVPKLRFLHGPSVVRSTLACHRRVIDELKPDVVLTFFAYPYGYAGVELARRHGLPAIVGVLGSDVNVKARQPLERPLIRRTFQRAARVLSVSAALGREVQGLGIDESHVAVIPNGIDAVRFVPMSRDDACARLGLDAAVPIIGCVSRLSREKGIDVLVRALALMRRSDARVKVVGHGVERENLERLARDEGVSDRIEFVGMKPHNEVPVWINAAQVMALPSRIEGHPNAVLEAMACGRPVVGSRVGGVPEAINSESVGALVDPDDAPGLAAALDDALGRTWDRDSIVAVGARRTWDTVAAEILEVIDEVLSNGASS